MSASHTVSSPSLHHESTHFADICFYFIALSEFVTTKFLPDYSLSLPTRLFIRLMGRKHVCLLATVLRTSHALALSSQPDSLLLKEFLLTLGYTEYFIVFLGALL